MATTLETGKLCTIVVQRSNFSFFADETGFMWNCTVVYLISFYRSVKKTMLETSRKKISFSTMCPKDATQYFRPKVKILWRNKKQTMTEIQGKFTCHVASRTKPSGSLQAQVPNTISTRLKVNLYALSFTDSRIHLNYLYLYYKRSQQCLHAGNSTVRACYSNVIEL